MGTWPSLFQPRPLNPAQVEKVERIRNLFAAISQVLEETMPEGKYKTYTEKALEGACFWAVKGVSHAQGDA